MQAQILCMHGTRKVRNKKKKTERKEKPTQTKILSS